MIITTVSNGELNKRKTSMFPTKSPVASCVDHPITSFSSQLLHFTFAKTALMILICRFPILLKIIERPMMGPTFCGKGSLDEVIWHTVQSCLGNIQ